MRLGGVRSRVQIPPLRPAIERMKYSISQQQRYWAEIPKKSSAIGVLLFGESGKVLIVKPHYKDHWTIPGGVIEGNESPIQAAVREVREEVGLDIQVERLLCLHYLQHWVGDKKYDSYKFCALARIEDSGHHKMDGEIEDSKWVTPAEAKKILGGSSVNLVKNGLKAIDDGTVVYFESLDKK